MNVFSSKTGKRLKDIARLWLPPRVTQYLSSRLLGSIKYIGPFSNWNEAKQQSVGYDSDLIIERTLQAALLVKHGKAAYERDSLIFEKADPPFNILSALLLAAALDRNTLTIFDLGGSLGSLYFRCNPFLLHLGNSEWCIIEQPRIVEAGKKYFEEDGLSFCETLNGAYERHGTPTIVCASSVLMYVGAVEDVCRKISELNPRVIFIDRTIFSEDDQEYIFVQRVPARLYPASYPSKFLSWSKICSFFEEKYLLVTEFPGYEGQVSAGQINGHYRGAIWIRRH